MLGESKPILVNWFSIWDELTSSTNLTVTPVPDRKSIPKFKWGGKVKDRC